MRLECILYAYGGGGGGSRGVQTPPLSKKKKKKKNTLVGEVGDVREYPYPVSGKLTIIF